MKSVQNKLAHHEGFGYPSTLPQIDCYSNWAHNLQDRVYRQNDKEWSFIHFSRETDKQSTVQKQWERSRVLKCAVSILDVDEQM